MKSITTFLNESLYPVKFAVKNFVNFIAEFTRLGECPKRIHLENTDQCKKVFAAFESFCVIKFGGKTPEILRQVNCYTYKLFKAYMHDHAEELEKNKANLNKFIDFNLSESEKAYKKYKKEHPEEFDAISDDDAQERDLTIYDRYNPSNHTNYKFVGKRGKDTEGQVNAFRQDFHYATGVKYYNCYSCLYSYYIEHKKDLEQYNDYIGIDD